MKVSLNSYGGIGVLLHHFAGYRIL